MSTRTSPRRLPLSDPRRPGPPLILRLAHARRRGLPPAVSALALSIAVVVHLAVAVLAPEPAHAATQGSGFGSWAPISRYGWHGSMLVDGVHTYCITPGAPAPTGPTTDLGVSATAAGLTPQQLAGINLLVTRYGQTDDPVTAAAVGWAVKAIADWDETLHAFGYPGDSLAGAIHWTLSALAPQHSTAVQKLAVAYVDEARAVAAPPAPSGKLVFATDADDVRSGSVRVDATVPSATGSLSLVNAVFADTGSATRDDAVTGVDYAIVAAPPAEGRPFSVSGTGRFSSGLVAAVRHYTTPGGQDTAGPAGELPFEVRGADAAPRALPFSPTITTQVTSRYAPGGGFVDDVTFHADEGTWPRGEDGSYLPVSAQAAVYRTDAEPRPGDAAPDAEPVARLTLTSDPATGPTAAYRVTSDEEMASPGFYTAVWSITAGAQTDEVGARMGAEYVWSEEFGVRTQVTMVPAITTTALPIATPGDALTDTVHVADPLPADGLRITSAVYRAVEGTSAADTCTAENLVWRSDEVTVTAAGDHTVTSPPVGDAGTYYWQEQAVDAAGDVVHLGVCGLENETTRVIAPKPASAPSPPQLPETGADLETLRAPTGIAVVLLAAGAAVLAARRPWFGARPDIG